MLSLWKKWTGGGKDMASLWGNFNICPQLHWLEFPCHSQPELFSISGLKVWGDAQKPCHNIAYLLVQVEDTKKDRHYGISLVWMHPNQVRVATMEEGSWKINCLHLQWGRLALCPSAAMWGSPSCTTPHAPQEQAPRHPTSEKAKETFCGQISQLKIHQLLAISPQVFYAIGLKWAWWTHYNHSTRAARQQYKPYCKWTYLFGDWYPFTPNGGTRPKDATSRGHPYHPDNQSPPKSEGSMTMEGQ